METVYQIEGISTGSEINEDLHDGIGISVGTPVGGLKLMGGPLIIQRGQGIVERNFHFSSFRAHERGLDCIFSGASCAFLSISYTMVP